MSNRWEFSIFYSREAMRRSVALVLFVVALTGCNRWTKASITPEELRAHVEYLASDELQGRETGFSGIRLAEEYIAEEFSNHGLIPVPGQDDHFIEFTLYRHTYNLEMTRIAFTRGEWVRKGELGGDFRPFWFSETGEAKAPVVFAGYGISAPEHKWDDYEGLDVEGKFVLVQRHEPNNDDPTSPFGGTEYSSHAYFVTKAQNAFSHGAVGMILFTDPLFPMIGADDLRLTGTLSLSTERRSRRSTNTIPNPSVHISRDLAAELIQPSGHSLEELQRSVDAGTKPSEIDLGFLEAFVSVGPFEEPYEVPARNVAGLMIGRVPELADEWIVIGGHHDHLGAIPVSGGDTVYNGADDNASGTAGVLELAERFALRWRPTRRSLLFITFSGEEMGLLGSRALFEKELLPTGRIVFMINLDMIGRNPNQVVRIFGTGFGLDLREIVKAVGERHDLPYRFAGIGTIPLNSDYGPFFDAHIPYLSFFTGEHEDYHQLTDHADRLDYERMTELLEMVTEIIEDLDAREVLSPQPLEER